MQYTATIKITLQWKEDLVYQVTWRWQSKFFKKANVNIYFVHCIKKCKRTKMLTVLTLDKGIMGVLDMYCCITKLCQSLVAETKNSPS